MSSEAATPPRSLAHSQQREERRAYRVKRRDVECDVMGRATQKTIWLDCPFCGTEVRARVWSLCGNGKRCGCGAMLYADGEARKLVAADDSLNAGVDKID